MKKIIACMALLSVAFASNAVAHGSKARHGGIVQTAGDLSFELVSKENTATIYVDDHGKNLATAGASGTLTVLEGTTKTVLLLKPRPENMLVATGTHLNPGTKAVASIKLGNKDIVRVRFSIK